MADKVDAEWMASKPEGVSDAVWKFIGDRPRAAGPTAVAILLEEALGIQRELHEKTLHGIKDFFKSYRHSARSEIESAKIVMERAKAEEGALTRAIDQVEHNINLSRKRGVVL